MSTDDTIYHVIKIRGPDICASYHMVGQERRYRETVDYEVEHGAELLGELHSTQGGRPMTVSVLRRVTPRSDI